MGSGPADPGLSRRPGRRDRAAGRIRRTATAEEDPARSAGLRPPEPCLSDREGKGRMEGAGRRRSRRDHGKPWRLETRGKAGLRLCHADRGACLPFTPLCRQEGPAACGALTGFSREVRPLPPSVEDRACGEWGQCLKQRRICCGHRAGVGCGVVSCCDRWGVSRRPFPFSAGVCRSSRHHLTAPAAAAMGGPHHPFGPCCPFPFGAAAAHGPAFRWAYRKNP